MRSASFSSAVTAVADDDWRVDEEIDFKLHFKIEELDGIEKLSRHALDSYPDGGLEAWLVVLGGWCALVCTFGLINSVGVFEQYYVSGPLKEYNQSTVSWILSALVFLQIFCGSIFGLMFDNYGPRWLLWGGSVTFIFGLMMLSFSTEYYQIFLSQGIVSAIGSAAVFHAAMSSIASWFQKNRAAAYGVLVTGSSFGGLFWPLMMDKLIAKIGFPWMMRVMSLIFMFLLAFACLTIKTRLPPKPRRFVVKEYLDNLKDIRLAVTSVAAFFFMLGMFLPFNYVLLQAEKAGFSPTLIPYLLPILNAVSIFGRLLSGVAADKVGRFNMMVSLTFFSALVCLVVWIPIKSVAGIIFFVSIFGFASGGFIGICTALVAQISDISQIGTRVGTLFAIESVGALIGSPIGGAIVAAQHGDYLGLQLFCGCSMMMGSILFVWARYIQVGFMFTKV
ncbi:hypothetical protein TRIATDRAFT_293107 [Trichoderma atroviride IMI 206040]|uniref:Major facilitator superfamily (MFS) profile domain-containing protein n=1 Tax=Hypocrea atroviridis (strain ATCC 20476 / IMI 206040) TaxID=452589 RepID=G9NYY5_HYPAI|nr:uncharacterized protein TRIATDRAFT_293107 [Trichoderma atroviride IMI 206040]EHK43755.1 hypothetical protein TRIATDRAFT_293107 [Trichoderma atroviride IMI 206040]